MVGIKKKEKDETKTTENGGSKVDELSSTTDPAQKDNETFPMSTQISMTCKYNGEDDDQMSNPVAMRLTATSIVWQATPQVLPCPYCSVNK